MKGVLKRTKLIEKYKVYMDCLSQIQMRKFNIENM